MFTFLQRGMPNIRIITSVIGRAQRGIGRAQLNIGRATALPGLYKTTPVSSLIFRLLGTRPPSPRFSTPMYSRSFRRGKCLIDYS